MMQPARGAIPHSAMKITPLLLTAASSLLQGPLKPAHRTEFRALCALLEVRSHAVLPHLMYHFPLLSLLFSFDRRREAGVKKLHYLAR